MGSVIWVAERSTDSLVPGFGHRVKSRSLDSTMSAIFLPAGMIWSSGWRSKLRVTYSPDLSGVPFSSE